MSSYCPSKGRAVQVGSSVRCEQLMCHFQQSRNIQQLPERARQSIKILLSAGCWNALLITEERKVRLQAGCTHTHNHTGTRYSNSVQKSISKQQLIKVWHGSTDSRRSILAPSWNSGELQTCVPAATSAPQQYAISKNPFYPSFCQVWR